MEEVERLCEEIRHGIDCGQGRHVFFKVVGIENTVQCIYCGKLAKIGHLHIGGETWLLKTGLR